LLIAGTVERTGTSRGSNPSIPEEHGTKRGLIPARDPVPLSEHFEKTQNLVDLSAGVRSLGGVERGRIEQPTLAGRSTWQSPWRRASMSAKRRRACRPRLDHLDGRVLLSGSPPAFPTPHIIKTAYYDNFKFSIGGTPVACNGSGQTIAIVDVGIDSTISTDSMTFDTAYNQTAPFPFMADAMPGAIPATVGWTEEESLDVEWAHAFAPQAGIDLVEAKSTSAGDLMAAVDYARHLPGVSVVSRSWGSAEVSVDHADDSIFTTPAGHRGVTFVAASGDDGGWNNPPLHTHVGVNWPASDPNVLSVGGSIVDTDLAGDYLGETAWSGSNGGSRLVYGEPAYQGGVQGSGHRSVPDVSLVASNLPLYDTSAGGWLIASGTSFAAPMWAGLIAKANQGRALVGLGALDGASQTLPLLYAPQFRSAFHDITTGSNGVYSAGPGYDLVTGLGSPISGLIVSDLSGVPIYHSNALVAAPSQSPPIGNPSAVAMAALPAPEGSSTLAPLGIEAPTHFGDGNASTRVPSWSALDPTATPSRLQPDRRHDHDDRALGSLLKHDLLSRF
jgi:hypothetical protein